MKSWRLKKISSFIKQGDIVADIGTDYGHLPVYLIKNQICPKVYASDILENPLEKAKEYFDKTKTTNVIIPILSDGLKNFSKTQKEEIDVIVVAGLGGMNISHILKDVRKAKVILEPRNKTYLVRQQLKKMNYYILDEDVVENKKIWNVFIVAEKREKTNIYDDKDCYVGPILKHCQTENIMMYKKKMRGYYELLYKKNKDMKNLIISKMF